MWWRPCWCLQALHGLSDREAARGGHVRSAVEGSGGSAGHVGGVPSDDADGVAAPVGRLGAPGPDLRGGPGGGGGDRGVAGQDPSGVGLHDPGRRGGPAGHRHPVDRRGPSGRAGRARRRRAGHDRVHRLRLHPRGQARHRLGRPRPPGRSWSRRWSTTRWHCWPGWWSGWPDRTPSSGTTRSARPPSRRSRCWGWSPGRTSNRPRARDGTDGRWRIARKVAPDRMISTVDPDARHAHKTRHRRQDGFKAHVVVEPDTGLITATELTKASGPDNSDATVGVRLLDTDPTLGQARAAQPIKRPVSRPRRRMAAGCRCWPTPRTAAAMPWPTCRPRATRRSSSRGRCARPSPAGSPPRTSPSTNPPAR